MPITVVVQGMQQLVADIHALVGEAKTASRSLREIAAAQNNIAETLRQLVPQPAVGVNVRFHTYKEAHMGEIVVVDTETTLHSTLQFVDAEGQPTSPPDGAAPTYSSSDEAVAVAHGSDDGLTATYDIGAPGDAVITVDGLGLTDPEGNPIQGKGTIHVTAGAAVVADVQFATG